MEEDPVMEAHEEFNEEPCQSQPQEEEGEEEGEGEEEEQQEQEEEEEKRMVHLQRDLMTSVTNIQTAADAKESMRRTDLEEARRIRLERLENDHKSSQEIFQEITRGWSAAKQKVIPQELQEALNNQQELCAALIQDKKKLINDLQQELKVGDDRFVKDLRKQEEELDLMMEMMENQIKTLTKAYREELAQISVGPRSQSRSSKYLVECILIYKSIWMNGAYCVSEQFYLFLQKEMKNLCIKSSRQVNQFNKNSKHLTEEYKRSIQQYESIRKKIKDAAISDARQFEEMWLMIEEEVKQLRERVLVIDSQICEQHLGLAWERPPVGFMELSGPLQPQKPLRSGQGPRPEVDTESTDMEVYKGAGAVPSDSGAEVEEGKLSMETIKKVMELLCDETSFLMEDKLLNLLASLEKEEELVVKLGSILSMDYSPSLLYLHANRGCTTVVNWTPSVRSEHEMMIQQSFLSEHVTLVFPCCFLRERSASQSFHVEARESSEDEAYWDSLGNIISDDKVKLWDAAGNRLKQYLAVLTEISELVPETQSLEQQNAELRMLLQQSLNSRHRAGDAVNQTPLGIGKTGTVSNV
uniref:Dynein regulatory complex protein 1 n=1 Tax=Cyclopterus lumpus TaxID=8103 RepID=A0A8C2WKG2_CYCLU